MRKRMLLLVGMICATLGMAETTIGFVDTQMILENYSKTKEIQNSLEMKKQNLQEMLNGEKEKITAKENEFLGETKELDEEEEKKLKKMQQDFQNKFQILQQELDKSQYIAYQNIKTDVSMAIKNVAQLNNINTILDKAVVYYGGKDITKDVIEFLSGTEKIELE